MKRKRIMIIGAILMIIGGVSAYEIWQMTPLSSLTWRHGFKYDVLKTISKKSYADALPADKATIKTIRIDATDSDVVITTGKSFNVLTSKYGGETEEQPIDITFQDGELSIKQKNTSKVGVDFNLLDDINPKITVEIPESSQVKVINATNENGDLTFRQLTNVKTISASNQNGDLEFRNLSKVDDISATNRIGDIEFKLVVATRAKVTTETGDLSLEKSIVKEPTFKTNNGDIDIEKSQLLGSGTITNETGDISFDNTKLPTYHLATTLGEKEVEGSQASNQTTKEKAQLFITNETGDIDID